MRSKVVLLVEDSPDDTDLVIRALRQGNLTNEVHLARDGVEAIDYLLAIAGDGRDPGLPLVMLLDLKLPRISGLEVLKRVRADERTRFLPVVILTSSREEQDVLAGYELGANSYVTKPVGFAPFADAIRQLGLYWLVINEPPPPTGDS
jgi:two-component system response regulator